MRLTDVSPTEGEQGERGERGKNALFEGEEFSPLAFTAETGEEEEGEKGGAREKAATLDRDKEGCRIWTAWPGDARDQETSAA